MWDRQKQQKSTEIFKKSVFAVESYFCHLHVLLGGMQCTNFAVKRF